VCLYGCFHVAKLQKKSESAKHSPKIISRSAEFVTQKGQFVKIITRATLFPGISEVNHQQGQMRQIRALHPFQAGRQESSYRLTDSQQVGRHIVGRLVG